MKTSKESEQHENHKKCNSARVDCQSSNFYIEWWMAFLALTGLSLITRLNHITEPSHVCWDETHFGKMGSWYLNRTFFFDVHPPLGKMLIGLAGHLTGYNGSFAFNKPGDEYGDTEYVGMRVFCAMLGASLVPVVYCITWELSRSLTPAILAALLVLCDTGTLTLSQYILLDPILLIFIMAATLCLLKFHNNPRCFSLGWWSWMLSTGFFLACAISVKFVGLFVVLFAGLTVASDLWGMLGDNSISVKEITRHFIARAFGLIFVPVCVYLLFFYIHFLFLQKSGTGDGFFSSGFQSQLQGNPLYNASMPEYVAYGSVVTLKNRRTGGAYLHSHWHLYPEGLGARQQQVTTYSHKDENNHWQLKRFDYDPVPDEDPVELIRHGDYIRLEHINTRRNLHGHREMAPLTKRHYQITCYGEAGVGDMNDVFRLDLEAGYDLEPVKPVKSAFRLIHYNTGCALHSHSKQLPKWGWDQLEVSCNPNTRHKNNLWNVEEVIDDRLPNKSFNVYAPNFWEKLWESHAVMAQGNSGLRPKEGEVTSQPWQWPVNYKGQPFSGSEYRVYLLGNPVVWWANLATLIIFVFLFCGRAIYLQRHSSKHSVKLSHVDAVCTQCGWVGIGWLLHYLPFWAMGRVLYFHHYFPAFLFSCIITGVMFSYIVETLSSMVSISHQSAVYHTLLGILISGIVYSFWVFCPLSYGMHGPLSTDPNSTVHGLRWMESWDF